MSFRSGLVRPDGGSALLDEVGLRDVSSGPLSSAQAELKKRLDDLALERGLVVKARFRLEVLLRGGPRRGVPVRGVVAVWTNGGYLHGGGDAAVYLCPQVVDGVDCMAPIDMQFVSSRPSAADPRRLEQAVVCTECRRVSCTEDLTGQIVYEVPVQRWAEILVHLYHRLGSSADLALTIERESLRKATEEETMRYRAGDAYARVERKRECVVYTLANIIADTASGAGLETRFRAFLEA